MPDAEYDDIHDIDDDYFDEEEYVERPFRRGRGGYDPETAALVAQAKYAFRRRVVAFLLAAAIVTGVVAGVYLTPLWYGHAASTCCSSATSPTCAARCGSRRRSAHAGSRGCSRSAAAGPPVRSRSRTLRLPSRPSVRRSAWLPGRRDHRGRARGRAGQCPRCRRCHASNTTFGRARSRSTPTSSVPWSARRRKRRTRPHRFLLEQPPQAETHINPNGIYTDHAEEEQDGTNHKAIADPLIDSGDEFKLTLAVDEGDPEFMKKSYALVLNKIARRLKITKEEVERPWDTGHAWVASDVLQKGRRLAHDSYGFGHGSVMHPDLSAPMRPARCSKTTRLVKWLLNAQSQKRRRSKSRNPNTTPLAITAQNLPAIW